MNLSGRKKIDFSAYVLFAPAFIVLVLFTLYPILWALLMSFKSPRIIELRGAGLFDFPGPVVYLQNYLNALRDLVFIKSLGNTLYFAVVYYPLVLLTSLGLAIVIHSGVRKQNWYQAVFFVPYVVSVISGGVIFLDIFRSDTGMLNNTLRAIGIEEPVRWLSSETWAMPVISLMSSWRKIGYYMLIFLAGLQNIPKSLYEAASIDGASFLQQVRSITLPLLSKIGLVVSVLLMVDTLRVFQEVYVMTGGGPANSTVTVPFRIYNEAFKYFRVGSATAMSYILLALVLFFFFVQQWILRANEK